MDNLNRLGANIRSLRKAYGETQAELGEVIGYKKSVVSYYETGRSEPDKETLIKIANHYMVSAEDLLHSELTFLGKNAIEVRDSDISKFWKNINAILPIISFDKALKNPGFIKAYDAHRVLYDRLCAISLDSLDSIDILLKETHVYVCMDDYMDVYLTTAEDDIDAAAAANYIALWCLLMLLYKMVPVVVKDQPAILRQMEAQNEKIGKAIKGFGRFYEAYEAKAKVILKAIDDDEMRETILEMLTIIKRAREWSDLADYYLALQYVWNLVGNDLGRGLNMRIGIEMLDAFASMGNIYASRFFELQL